MALDHYVSQVHLSNFSSSTLGGRLHAIRKSDLKYFRPRTRDVCRIEDGSTNEYLKNDRAIEEFLKGVEPKYNASVKKLRENKIDKECIHAIAGFIAYVATCTPAAMRIWSMPLRLTAEGAVLAMEAQSGPSKASPTQGWEPWANKSASKIVPMNDLSKDLVSRSAEPYGLKEQNSDLAIEATPDPSKAPADFSGKSVTELLEEGIIRYNVDPKLPQAWGISGILQRLSRFGNAQWEILRNVKNDSPFFTSDNPLAIERRLAENAVANHIVPLMPDLALRITTSKDLKPREPDLAFAKFSSTQRTLSHNEVLDVNRMVVRCAEDCVFFRDNHDWVAKFVEKNRNYRINPVTRTSWQGNLVAYSFSQEVRPT